ncbi:acyltransferase family protein [Chromatiaceae bacterium AAb-1]|nr:acyltransferase family protein [Chromatiaceae bacterium AAb-1]
MTQNHYSHITVARGMSIILVAFGHAQFPAMNDYLTSALGVVRMPFFFLLTGLFFSSAKSWPAYSERKVSALLKPYFFVLLLIGLKQWLDGDDMPLYLQGIFYGNGQTIPWTPLWFLPHLFLLYMLAMLVFRHYQLLQQPRWQQVLVVAGLLLAGGALLNALQTQLFSQATSPLLQTGLPWGLDFLLLSFGFFTIGYLSRQYVLHLQFQPLWLGLAAALFLLLVAIAGARLDFNLRLYTPYWCLPLISLTGCMMLLQLAVLFSRVALLKNVLAICGQYSLYILIFHVFIQMKLNTVFPAVTFSNSFMVLFGSIAMPVMAGIVIRRFFWLRLWFEPISSAKRVTG